MGEEVSRTKYLHPLTIQAEWFFNSMLGYMADEKFAKIDLNLLDALENVVRLVGEFMGSEPGEVVETSTMKLVDNSEIDNIKCIYHCSKCKMDIGKSIEKAADHLMDEHRNKLRHQKKKGKDTLKRLNPTANMPKKARSLLDSGLNVFFRENAQVAEKLKAIPDYEVIENELLEAVKPIFPEKTVKIYKFGSRMNGLGTRNSDLDLFVDIGNTFNVFENRASDDTLQNLHSVSVALRGSKHWRHIVAIDNARVPIVRVLNARTKIPCDIGFSNSLGFCNTKLLEFLFDLQPIGRLMCMFLKRWADRANLSIVLTTYSLALMVIYFLQLRDVMPSIEELQEELSTTLCVGPWIGNFERKSLSDLEIDLVEPSPTECTKYITDFFCFYSEFDFSSSAICPYLGIRIKIQDIEDHMPERYVTFVMKNEAPRFCGLELNRCIVVQDPLQLNHNVTKNTRPVHLQGIRDYFTQSAKIMMLKK